MADEQSPRINRYHSHIRRRDAVSLTTLRLARDVLKVSPLFFCPYLARPIDPVILVAPRRHRW